MTARSGAMHVARNKRTYVAKSGERRVYESVLVRRTYRDGGKVRHETLANLSALPAEAVAAIEATLKGERLVPAARAVTITASLPHGHVAAVHAMAAQAGPARRCWARPAPQRDLALALVISRVLAPASKLSTRAWWADTTLGADLGIAGASHRRHLRRDGLAGRPPGRDRGGAGPPPPGTGGQPGADGAVRPVQLVAGGPVLPAGRPGLLPGRQERQAADRVRAAHRPRRPPGRGPGASPAIPATRPRSPRSSRSCGRSSGWPRWSWSATGA